MRSVPAIEKTVFTDNQPIFSVLIAAVLCFSLILWFSAFARRVNLVDRPDERKHHAGEIPIIGGVCIYLSALVALALVHASLTLLTPLLVGAGLVVLGVIDDRVGLSTGVRFPVQVATAMLMMSIGGVGIESIGNVTGQGPVMMGTALSFAFTVVCTVGVINSINMIDGVDGLSGTIVGITLATLAWFNYVAGDMGSVSLLLALLAANLVFLMFNSRMFRSSAAIFMGDAGSTLFGFLLVWYFISLTQGADAVLSPVAAGWIFGLPLMDTVAVMARRVIQKRSPFDADRHHLHHRLLAAGFTPNRVVLIMAGVHLWLVVGGFVCNAYPALEPLFFWAFVLLVCLHFFVTPRITESGSTPASRTSGVSGHNASDSI